MNMIASTVQARIETPAVRFEYIEPAQRPGYPLQPIEAPRQEEEGDLPERRQARRAGHVNGAARQADERGFGWTIDTSGSGRETKTAREILDTIDADTLRAAQVKGGTSPQIEVNRDRIAALLGLCDEWKRPDEVYADEAWEICIIWRSGYGRVEIGTEEDGRIGYYVSRTLSEESREGNFREHSRKELDRVMSWLDEAREEI